MTPRPDLVRKTLAAQKEEVAGDPRRHDDAETEEVVREQLADDLRPAATPDEPPSARDR